MFFLKDFSPRSGDFLKDFKGTSHLIFQKRPRISRFQVFSDFFKNFATWNSCNFVPTGPISKFLVPRMCSSSWKARKCYRRKGIFSSNHFLVRWRLGGFLNFLCLVQNKKFPIQKRSSYCWKNIWYHAFLLLIK